MSPGIAASLHCVANMFANTPVNITTKDAIITPPDIIATKDESTPVDITKDANRPPDIMKDFFESKKDFWLKLRLEGVEGARDLGFCVCTTTIVIICF
jgi:hypothetical protein